MDEGGSSGPVENTPTRSRVSRNRNSKRRGCRIRLRSRKLHARSSVRAWMSCSDRREEPPRPGPVATTSGRPTHRADDRRTGSPRSPVAHVPRTTAPAHDHDGPHSSTLAARRMARTHPCRAAQQSRPGRCDAGGSSRSIRVQHSSVQAFGRSGNRQKRTSVESVGEMTLGDLGACATSTWCGTHRRPLVTDRYSGRHGRDLGFSGGSTSLGFIGWATIRDVSLALPTWRWTIS